MSAAWRQRTSVVQLLLEDKSVAQMTDDRGRNIWHRIASNEDRRQSDDTTKLLFAMKDADTNVNAIDKQGQTPLHLTAYFGTIAIAEELLNHGHIDLEAVETHEGKTALHFAAANGDTEFIKLLLEKRADRFDSCKGGLIPLHLVCGCMEDAVDAAELLMGQEPEKQLESQTQEFMTPLHIAAAHGNEAVVNLILQTRSAIDVDARCEGGWTALHLASGRHMSDPR